MKILSKASKFNTISFVLLSAIIILSHGYDTFGTDIFPHAIYAILSVLIVFFGIRIFIDHYRAASRERTLKVHEAHEAICLMRRQTGMCPLIGLACMRDGCCQRLYNPTLSTSETKGNTVLCLHADCLHKIE